VIEFIHTADWHIYDRHPQETDGERLAKIESNIKLMVRYAVKNMKHPRIVVCGDVFQNDNPSRRLISVFTRCIKYGTERNVEWRVISGNHDSNGIECALDALIDISGDFAFITQPYIEVVDGVQVYYLPWKEDIQQAIIDAGRERDKTMPNVLVTHCATSGAMSDSGHQLKNMEVDPRVFKGWDYVALGDYHKAQWVIRDKVYYSGDIARLNWGERNNPISFAHVRLEKGKPLYHHRYKLPDVEMIEIHVTEDGAEQLIQSGTETHRDVVGSFVRVYVHITPQSSKRGVLLAQIKSSLEQQGARRATALWKSEGMVSNTEQSSVLDLDIESACIRNLCANGIESNIYKTYITEILGEQKEQ
jgi:DNA repair exonuclease SbcCD nuclease subunit